MQGKENMEVAMVIKPTGIRTNMECKMCWMSCFTFTYIDNINDIYIYVNSKYIFKICFY